MPNPTDRLAEIERIHRATVQAIGDNINALEGAFEIDPELEYALNRESELIALCRAEYTRGRTEGFEEAKMAASDIVRMKKNHSVKMNMQAIHSKGPSPLPPTRRLATENERNRNENHNYRSKRRPY